MYHTFMMKAGAEKAQRSMHQGHGGPFGAVIVRDEQIISVASNTVLKDHDPTAHAEINAIREAGKILGTHDLSGCELYATGYPCPMCMSAIIWSNIKTIYYSGDVESADKIGFRDVKIYDWLESKSSDSIQLIQKDPQIAQSLYDTYASSNGTLY